MSERTDVSMWQRFLDRYVPVLPDLPSTLDRADGVGRRLPQVVQAPDRGRSVATATRALSAS
jgi:hypothetical protein